LLDPALGWAFSAGPDEGTVTSAKRGGQVAGHEMSGCRAKATITGALLA